MYINWGMCFGKLDKLAAIPIEIGNNDERHTTHLANTAMLIDEYVWIKQRFFVNTVTKRSTKCKITSLVQQYYMHDIIHYN